MAPTSAGVEADHDTTNLTLMELTMTHEDAEGPSSENRKNNRGDALQRLGRKMLELMASHPELREFSDGAVLRKPRRRIRRLPIKRSEGIILYLKVEQIDWIEAANQYVLVHQGKNSYLLRESMNRLEGWLDQERFFRTHRSAIVNLERVREVLLVAPTIRWAILDGGTRIQVSQNRWKEFEEALEWHPWGFGGEE
ncbi:MAG: LytTR family transcriptional regulator [bacterium]|nr:LytTR family transcriptional regulator [bacterium]